MTESLDTQFPTVIKPEEPGHWEMRVPNQNHRTPKSRLGRIANSLSHAYPDGWRFVEEERTSREKLGRVEFFVPGEQEDKQEK